MLGKLRPRSIYDVMAAIACFGVLAGGTAYAAATIGSSDVIDETLLSQDIRNGQVRWDDVGPNAVGSSRVFDETLLSQDIKNGQVKWDDVAPNAVGSARVHDETLLSQDVKNDTLTGNDINESTLRAVPGAAQAFARIDENNQLDSARSSNVTSVRSALGCTASVCPGEDSYSPNSWVVCFKLPFTPRGLVATVDAGDNESADDFVATGTLAPSAVPSTGFNGDHGCPSDHTSAKVITTRSSTGGAIHMPFFVVFY